MQSNPLWLLENVSSERSAALVEPFEFADLIRQMQSQVRNVRYKKDKGSHEAKGSWRPIIWFDVEEQTYDRFFNSPYGYRGRFLVNASVGQKANTEVVIALANLLVESLQLMPLLQEQVRQSLLSLYAKIWIEEDQHSPRKPDLVIQVLVPEWVVAATSVYKRLAGGDATLTQKEIDRIYGVRAPSGTTLKIMGAWIDPNGSLSVVPSKYQRAEEIKAYGVS